MGVVSTRVPLDREQRRVLLVPLVVTDAGSPPLSSTVTLTLHVADLNDNPMLPATKTVAALTIQVCLYLLHLSIPLIISINERQLHSEVMSVISVRQGRVISRECNGEMVMVNARIMIFLEGLRWEFCLSYHLVRSDAGKASVLLRCS